MNPNNHYKIAKLLAKLLDEGINIFGFSIGLDPLLGLFEWVGDLIAFGLGLYIIWVGYLMGVGNKNILLMFRNSVLDLIVGFVPVVGDILDFAIKSNIANIEIIEKNKNKILKGEILESV